MMISWITTKSTKKTKVVSFRTCSHLLAQNLALQAVPDLTLDAIIIFSSQQQIRAQAITIMIVGMYTRTISLKIPLSTPTTVSLCRSSKLRLQYRASVSSTCVHTKAQKILNTLQAGVIGLSQVPHLHMLFTVRISIRMMKARNTIASTKSTQHTLEAIIQSININTIL